MALTAEENQRLYDLEHLPLEIADRREALNDVRLKLHDDQATLKLYQALELLKRADKLLTEAFNAEYYRFVGEGRLEPKSNSHQI